MSYDLNLFIPSPNEDMEESFERQSLRDFDSGAHSLGPANQSTEDKNEAARVLTGLVNLSAEDKIQASRIIVELQSIDSDIESSECECFIELVNAQGVQISFYGGGSASIAVPYWYEGQEARKMLVRISKYLYIFGRHGYCVQDPQCDRFSRLDKVDKTYIDEMLSNYLSTVRALKSVDGNGEQEQQCSSVTTSSDRFSFLQGVEPLRLQLKPMKRGANIHNQLHSYFLNRTNYSLKSNRALYQNPDTDVCFEFELPAQFNTSGNSTITVEFVLDLGRPDPFAMEADAELQAFTEANAYQCKDCAHTFNEPYKSERFFEVWQRENPHAVRRFLFDGGRIAPYTLAGSAIIDQIWQWNFSLPTLKALHTCGLIVPKIELWRSTYLIIEAVVEENILAPASNVWIAIQPREKSVCYLIPSSRFTATACQLSQCESTVTHKIVHISQEHYKRSLPEAIVCSQQEFSTALHSFQRLIQSELVEEGREANKRSSKTCLKPPRRWE